MIVTPDEMAAIDRAAPVDVDTLIRRAGTAVALRARALLGGTYGRTVNVLAGKGNNGRDALVAADWLERHGVRVRRFHAADLPAALPPADLVVDGAYGTGFRGRWNPPQVGATPVLAVDVPSGVDALTGAVDGPVLRAQATVTFAALKPGMLFEPGRRFAGDVTVADIGLDVSRGRAWLVGPEDLRRWLRPRPATAHKWSSAVRIVAGSPGMTGAAALCSASAARAGAGMIVLSSPATVATPPAEVVVRRVPDEGWAGPVLDDLGRFRSLVVGPGLGRDSRTVAEARHLIARCPLPVVVDGDGLFAVGWGSAGPEALLAERSAPTVLTPHDGEFETLTGHKPGLDRIEAARRLSASTRSVVLLKGPTTVVADLDGRCAVVANGDARLATAGTGDVLSGLIGAFLAAGMRPAAAAAAGAWVHAEAARLAPATGMIASDLVAHIGAVLDSVTAPSEPPTRPRRR